MESFLLIFQKLQIYGCIIIIFLVPVRRLIACMLYIVHTLTHCTLQTGGALYAPVEPTRS
jgi:hypothetical protein